MAKIVVPTSNTVITSAWGKSVAAALVIGTGTEATSNTIAATAPIVLDGRPIMIEFMAGSVTLPAGAGNSFVVWLFEDAVSLGYWAVHLNSTATAGQAPITAKRRLAAPTGTRTYSARAACTPAGSATVNAGSPNLPAFIRVTRASGPTYP